MCVVQSGVAVRSLGLHVLLTASCPGITVLNLSHFQIISLFQENLNALIYASMGNKGRRLLPWQNIRDLSCFHTFG